MSWLYDVVGWMEGVVNELVGPGKVDVMSLSVFHLKLVFVIIMLF